MTRRRKRNRKVKRKPRQTHSHRRRGNMRKDRGALFVSSPFIGILQSTKEGAHDKAKRAI